MLDKSDVRSHQSGNLIDAQSFDFLLFSRSTWVRDILHVSDKFVFVFRISFYDKIVFISKFKID
ncbi:hypothetical protein WK68_12935 [Burkholderia ubonensis]|nr:hypothetical protein WK68_12935 [Burkholderia ubonensis]